MAPKRVLKECHVFEELDDSELERLAAICEPREYGAGATVFSAGSPADALYVVEQGKVALQMELPGPGAQGSRRVTVDVVTRGEVFGWSAAAVPHRYTLTAMCLEPTKVLAIDSARLGALLQGDYRIGFKVMVQLVGVVASRLDETRRVLVSERLVSLQR